MTNDDVQQIATRFLHRMKFTSWLLSLAMWNGSAGAALATEPFPGVEPSTTCPNPRADVVDKPFPKYPRDAIKDGQSGWVIVEFDVLADGSTTNFRVVGASPPGLFEATALEAFSHWKYLPDTARVGCRVDAQFNVK